MNVLIVYTHPNHESLNYGMLQSTLDGLKLNPKSNDVKILDLYSDEFDPVLHFNRNKRRRDMHIDPDMESYRQQFLWANKIVFIYPIWWGRPPAMLMGYFDKLMATNFAYKDNGGIMPEGLLKGKSIVCISTMKGPTSYPLLFLNNAHKVLMKRAIFNYVGIKSVKFFEFGSMESKKGNQEKGMRKVRDYFKKVS